MSHLVLHMHSFYVYLQSHLCSSVFAVYTYSVTTKSSLSFLSWRKPGTIKKIFCSWGFFGLCLLAILGCRLPLLSAVQELLKLKENPGSTPLCCSTSSEVLGPNFPSYLCTCCVSSRIFQL